MKLKKLEILGFKSFADKTKLEFHEGITAVVGPNGCGKSNIADAFRWVLGEQSAKSLRGGKMPDVIFAGTIHRKPLNFAEVTIILDDISGKLPIDYEEVAITRRLHRSGESEYFINRNLVRLKDIQSLFLDSGMGKDAYSVFEQGKIDQVINLSPLERRYIFEEAAGILRFLQRKKEALRKLEHADLNVSRVKDIHQEVEKQIIVLEQQAEKALHYRKNKSELETLEKALLVAKWENIQKRLSEAQHKKKDIATHIAAFNTQIEAFQAEFIEAKHAMESAERSLRTRTEEVYQARSTKEIKWKEKQSSQERLKELSAKEKRWQHELEAMLEKRNHRDSERYSLKKAHAESQKQLVDIEAILKTQREVVFVLDKKLGEHQQKQQYHQQEFLRFVQEENRCESDVKQSELRIENGKERQKQLQNSLERLHHSESELSSHIKEKTKEFNEGTCHTDTQKDSLASMENTLHELTDQISQVEEQVDLIQVELVEAKARHKVLDRLRADLEGFSSGSKHLLQESGKSSSPFFNKIKGLYEYIVPKKGHEGSVAIALKAYEQTLVVENKEDFQAVLAFAKEHDIKDFSLFCMEAARQETPQQNAAHSNKKMQPLTNHVFDSELAASFLKDSYLASSFDDAFHEIVNCKEIEIVTADGMLIDRRSVVFHTIQGENNVFLREVEIKAIEKKIVDYETEKKRLEDILKVIYQKKNMLHTERVELDKTIRRNEMKLVEVNFSLQRFKSDLNSVRSEKNTLKTELEILVNTLNEHTAALNDLKQRHTLIKTKAVEAKIQGETGQQAIENESAALRLEAAHLQEIDAQYQKFIEENRKHAHALHVLEVKDIESEQQEKRLEEEIEMGRHQQSLIQNSGSEVEKMLREVEQNLEDVTAACKELEQDVSIRKSVIEHLETKINEKRTLQKKQEADSNQIDVQCAQLESIRTALEGELQERHHLTIIQAKEMCETLTMSLDSAEKLMRTLRQQIENSGDINMTSIEECEKYKERYQFLNQQIDDLNLSKNELIAIITDLDEESRKIFKATFEQISLNFKKNFRILFNGGEADLQFTETADILEAGIEIIAKPPGKQMRSISLLSGGEKCLTAMALLFAIFEVKPAPFCILDEIDAPLDDTNVERFVNIVKEFVDRCQFIIITHNKRTMAIADMLFGVSMEERGVSKLLSMDFSTENEHKTEPVLL